MRLWLRRRSVLGLAATVLALSLDLRAQSPRWTVDRLTTATHAPHDAPPTNPVVLVQRPTRASGSVDAVLYLHGYSACIAALAASTPTACAPEHRLQPGWGLFDAHREAGIDAWFVLPQLAFLARDSSPGRFARRGEGRLFLEEVLAQSGTGARLGRVTLVAHSAGFHAAIALTRHGELPIDTIVLLDALYAGTDVFTHWMRTGRGRRLVSVVAPTGAPRENSLAMVRRLPGARRRSWSDALEPIVPGVTLVEVPFAHGAIPARTLTALLRALASP